jgi:hypothetical protein
MAPATALRRPVSTRHAYALAFDLTLLRDPLHSMVVPFLVRGPWVLAGALLPTGGSSPGAGGSPLGLLSTVVLLGGSISWWAVDAMLRVRARSVFYAPHETPPAPAGECYRYGLARLPWLYATEFVRGVALALGFGMFVLPGIYLGYKLAFATEAVVLNDRNLFGAFEHSFHLARGRFERWLEMVVVSVVIVLGVLFLGTVLSMAVSWLSFDTWKTVTLMLLVLLWPVFQYAWTFFYLRLVEIEEPQIHESGPFKSSSGMVGPWSHRGVPRPRPTPGSTAGPASMSLYDGD